jgi:putative endonuclease
MNQFYVYIIYNLLLDKYYIGYTTDLEKRLTEYNAGISSFTSKTYDWELKHSEIFSDRESAIQRERGRLRIKKAGNILNGLIAGLARAFAVPKAFGKKVIGSTPISSTNKLV